MALIQVPITKGKGFIEINTDDPESGGDLPADVFAEVVLQGLKVLLNRGASKITKEAYPKEDELKDAAMKKAKEQLELVKTSKIKFTGQKAAKKASGAIMTEARRLAKNLVKDEMKRQGIKVSHVDAKEITKAANLILETRPDLNLIQKAEENLKAREAVPEGGLGIDLKGLIPVNEAKKAKAEAKKKPLSATQAGKVQKRAKPAAQPTAH